MNKLNILWTTSNKDTVTNMLAMYTCNAFKHSWWEEIHVLIWGGSTKLISEDESVQALVAEMVLAGVKFEACKACADIYNVSEKLQGLGVDVKYMGEGLTNYIKSNDCFITL
ncbi:MAG: DsrE family protein [Clostridia bacterium]|nr:DsrE family protein [Clostridia bacterium]